MSVVVKEEKKRKIDVRYNLSVYFSILKKYTPLFIFGLLVIFLVEGLQVVDKLLFKVIIDNGTKFDGKTLVIHDFVSLLLSIAAVFVVVVLIRAGANWFRIHIINVLEARMIMDIKRRFFDHILHLSHGFHTSHKTGSLISRLIRGGGAMERMTDVIVFNVAPLLFQLTAVTLSLLYFDWVPALVVLLTVLTFIGYSLLIQLRQQSAHLTANLAEDREKAYISDVFTNIDSIKYFGKETTITSKFRALSETARETLLKAWNFWRWLDAGHTFILGVGTFFLVYFSLKNLLRGDITVGTIVFIYSIYGNLMPPLYGFVHGMRNIYRSMADFEDLFMYGKLSNDIKDKPHAKKLTLHHGIVDFRNISFRYHSAYVLKNFSLSIHKNEKVALVGHSGSGKSTLVKLLYRFYDVEKGAILLDGQDIRHFEQESLRSELSIVPQECVLFDDTIYNNIAFSNPAASKKEVWDAIKFSQLDKTIQSFPFKEQTIVGERGVKLSGGEKQRVSIARALLANKKILILDEATSSLDSQTEYDIQRALKRLMQGRTALIIAHRLSTIMNTDKIVVMDHGSIIQIGTHRELIKRKGKYRTLWRLQHGGFIK